MKSTLVFVSFLFLLTSNVAFALNKNYEIGRALRTITVLKEFHELYHSSFYKMEKRHGRWIIEGKVLITPSYEFTLIVPISEPGEGNLPIAVDRPEFTLEKITRVYYDDHGDLAVDKDPFPIAEFSTETWIKLYLTKGNFYKVGIELKGSEPMTNIEDYFSELRAHSDY